MTSFISFVPENNVATEHRGLSHLLAHHLKQWPAYFPFQCRSSLFHRPIPTLQNNTLLCIRQCDLLNTLLHRHKFKLNPKSLVPVCRVHHYGAGVGHLALQESLACLAGFLQLGHTDGLLRSIVCPVQVLTHPVHCYSLDRVDSYRETGV